MLTLGLGIAKTSELRLNTEKHRMQRKLNVVQKTSEKKKLFWMCALVAAVWWPEYVRAGHIHGNDCIVHRNCVR